MRTASSGLQTLCWGLCPHCRIHFSQQPSSRYYRALHTGRTWGIHFFPQTGTDTIPSSGELSRVSGVQTPVAPDFERQSANALIYITHHLERGRPGRGRRWQQRGVVEGKPEWNQEAWTPGLTPALTPSLPKRRFSLAQNQEEGNNH